MLLLMIGRIMGHQLSVICRPCHQRHNRHYQLSKYLTPGQVHVIQRTWSILKLDLISLGLTVFLHFLETEPDLKMLFPKMIRINEKNQLEWDVEREMLQKYALTVMEGLGAAVETLHDSQLLNSVLIALGQTHEQRNIKPHKLKKMWPSLQIGLAAVLGHSYTKEVNQAWKKLYKYMCLQMKIGMDIPDDLSKP